MQIKSIREKLEFEVEAQDKCPHGKSRLSASCSTDCKEVKWSGLNKWWTDQDDYFKDCCKSTTTYTCSTFHVW